MAEEQKIQPETAKKSNKYLIPILIIAVVALGLSTVWFGWQYYHLNSEKRDLQTSVSVLNTQMTNLKNELGDAKKSASPTPVPNKSSNVTSTLLENVSAAISTKNTAALEDYMASSVNVIMAASEGIGSRTPAQAVSDLNYLNPATSPWNFSLPATTIATYRAGYYNRYFGDNTIIGQSSDNYVVSFGVNSNGKIDTIFMAVNADLLK